MGLVLTQQEQKGKGNKGKWNAPNAWDFVNTMEGKRTTLNSGSLRDQNQAILVSCSRSQIFVK